MINKPFKQQYFDRVYPDAVVWVRESMAKRTPTYIRDSDSIAAGYAAMKKVREECLAKSGELTVITCGVRKH